MIGLRAHHQTLLVGMLLAFAYALFVAQYGYGFQHITLVDLPSFHSAARLAFDLGKSPYAPELLDAQLRGHVYPYLYPPPSLLLFQPLSLLSYEAARVATLVGNHLLVLLLIYLLPFRLLGLSLTREPVPFGLAVLYLLAFYPIVRVLDHGQVNLVLACLITGFWILARSGRDLPAGALLAVVILLKVNLAAILPFLLICRANRVVAWCVGALLGATALSFVWLPTGVWADWYQNVLPTAGYGRTPLGLFSPAYIDNQSLNGIFSRLFTASDWSAPILESPALAVGLTTIASAALIGASLVGSWLRRRGGRSGGLDHALALALPALYLSAPLSWEHHLAYLLPILLVLLSPLLRGHWARPRLVGVLAVAAALTLALQGAVAWKGLAVMVVWAIALFQALRSEAPPAEYA
jgi:alpha-1,2-mannosyltransferase